MDKIKSVLRIVVFALITSMSPSVFAIDANQHWKTFVTPHFKIHFAEGYESQAEEVADIAESVHAKLQPMINWQPREKTHLVVSDETDFANGYATPVSFNRSVLFVAPPDEARGIEDYSNWLETLIIHEYVHVLHLDKTRGGAEALRNVFGRQFLLFPNAYQPAWLIEGLATDYETRYGHQVGRGQSALFRAMMQAEIENAIKPVSQVNLPLRSWPMGSTPYLYGVFFYQFLEETYGEQAIHALIEEYSDNIIPFRINTNAEYVLGKDIETLWREYSDYLTKRFERELTDRTDEEKLTSSGYNTQNFSLNASGQPVYVEDGAVEHTAVRVIEEDANRKVAEVHKFARIGLHPEQGILISQPEYCDEYNLNFDLYVLQSSEVKRLTKCGRYRWATWTSSGENIIAIKLVKGKSWLVVLDQQGRETDVLWKSAQGEVLSYLDYSPLRPAVVTAKLRKGLGWDIAEFDLQTKEWRYITSDKAIDMYPSYVNDGAILFSSDRNGQYQIYRAADSLERISDTAYAAFKPRQQNADSALYYAAYHASGSDIYRVRDVKVYETVEREKTDHQAETQAQSKNTAVTVDEYSAWDSLYPRWWLPDISITDERSEYGLFTSAHDALALHRYQLNLRYDTTNEWLAGSLSYAYTNRFSAGYARSSDIFLDQNRELALARQVDDWFAVMQFNFPAIETSTSLFAGITLSRSSDAWRAENVLPQSDTKDNLFALALLHRSTQRYIRSISESDGRRIRLIAESSEVIESDFSGEVYTLDWREYVSLGAQHVLAIRLVQGWGTDLPEVFRLGGEDNDYALLDLLNPVREPLFSRREYPLRGYAEGLVELRGRRMQLASLEWRIPGSLVERGWMTPPVGLSQWSTTVFAESGAAYTDNKPETYYSSVGIELAADINLFYGVNSHMRLGFAHGLDEQLGEDRLYFMLGASF